MKKAKLELARHDFEMGDHVCLQRVQEHIQAFGSGDSWMWCDVDDDFVTL